MHALLVFSVSVSLAGRLAAMTAGHIDLLDDEQKLNSVREAMWFHTESCNLRGIGAFRPSVAS